MSGNTDAIYSKAGVIEWGAVLTTAAADYTGYSNLNAEVFHADDTNGGFAQRLVFKALGTNVASVARIYVNNGLSNQQVITAPGTPTGTPSASGGTLDTRTTSVFAKIVPIGQGGDVGTASAENATGISTTGPSASILWGWTAPSGFTVSAYRVHVGTTTNQEVEYFWAPTTTVTASQSGNTLTVTAIVSAPNTRICKALGVGVVFSSGIGAGTYIVSQLTSAEANGALGRTGTYTLSASATVGSTSCVTDPLKYEQLSPAHAMIASFDGQVSLNNNLFVGEISLPATTAIATAATTDMSYPLGFALPPGYEIYVGLGTAVAAGWHVGCIGGAY